MLLESDEEIYGLTFKQLFIPMFELSFQLFYLDELISYSKSSNSDDSNSAISV